MIMKRKILNLSSLVLIIANCAFAQLTNQLPHFPTKPWKATVKVVGEDGLPIGGANVVVGYFLPPYAFSDDPEYSDRITGMTDTNGIFFATHDDRTGEIGFSVNKDGYYETRSVRTLRDPADNANDRDLSLTLALKKIGKPIAMYAKRLNTHVPDLDKPVGFDLDLGDWVGPYGKGVNADILFTGHFDKKADGESDYTLTVSFPKIGDGIQEFMMSDAEGVSGLRSAHEAPVAGYQSQWVQTDNRKPGKPIETNRDLNRNYYFRILTKLDENGNVVSAHYGKIYGDFMQFSYYLNPTPNDRNVEFDSKQNLLGGLRPTEEVGAP